MTAKRLYLPRQLKYVSIVDYDQFKQRVRRYKRDDVMIQSSFLAWKAWEVVRVPENERMDRVLVRAHGPRVFAIAAASGTNFNRLSPQGTNTRDLCKLVIEVTDTVSDREFLNEEKELLVREIENTEHLSQFNISADLIRSAAAGIFVMRLARSQWDAQAYTFRHIARSWMIYKIFRESNPDIGDIVARLLQQSDLDAVRSTIGLWALFSSKPLDFSRPFLDLYSSTCDQEVTERMNIDLDTIKIAASRLSIAKNDLHSWHAEVQRQSPCYKKYYPLPFYKNPLLEGQEYDLPTFTNDSDSLLICPSPQLLLCGAATWIPRIINENPRLFEDAGISDTMVALGDATEEYLARVLPIIFGAERVERIQDRTRRNADFVVDLPECFLVIECKRVINNRWARSILTPQVVAKVWDKLADALSQCSGTIDAQNARFTGQNKPVICFILADDVVLGEDGVFADLVEASGTLKSLGVLYFEVMSFDDFEKIFLSYPIAEIIQRCVEKWNRFRHRTHYMHWQSLAMTEWATKPLRRFPHLEQETNEIIPPRESDEQDQDLEDPE